MAVAGHDPEIQRHCQRYAAADAKTFDGADGDLPISCQARVSCDEIDLSKIMRVADRALYAAKPGGRNRVARADAPALAAA
jgi:GGDEF domain-containing protein